MDYQKCARVLKQNDNILLVTHKNPDGDCMASAAALCSALRRAGKTAYLFPNTQVIKKLRPFVEEYFAPEGFVAEFTVSVDVATEQMFALGFEGEVNLCIDHHPTNSRYAKDSLIRAEKSSCGEVVMRVVKNICGDISKTEANLLYIALFRYPISARRYDTSLQRHIAQPCQCIHPKEPDWTNPLLQNLMI